ncbi:hypothetical protein GCM10007855_41990 [Aliivibrio sifiae]|uniref:Uncharacterized protein n=1 Tax=Aliivibrio sifiae TaxID=566293 RepID=A0ABQ6APU6_9GAMM|nr:hypothetical protein GCM10007855_41990 [Aliivibrio sifiae]
MVGEGGGSAAIAVASRRQKILADVGVLLIELTGGPPMSEIQLVG